MIYPSVGGGAIILLPLFFLIMRKYFKLQKQADLEESQRIQSLNNTDISCDVVKTSPTTYEINISIKDIDCEK